MELGKDIDNTIFNINSSHDVQFFGKNAKLYIQISSSVDGVYGFWLDNSSEKGKTIFILPEIHFEALNLIIMTTE